MFRVRFCLHVVGLFLLSTLFGLKVSRSGGVEGLYMYFTSWMWTLALGDTRFLLLKSVADVRFSVFYFCQRVHSVSKSVGPVLLLWSFADLWRVLDGLHFILCRGVVQL